MAGPPPRTTRAPKPQEASSARPKKRRPTAGERTAAREEKRRQRRAHLAGMRAIRREQWNRVRALVVPPYTRDVGRSTALLILILNIAPFPGLGTALYGKIERGVAQFVLTFVFLIGWIWSIADGVRIVTAAYRQGPSIRGRVPGDSRRRQIRQP